MLWSLLFISELNQSNGGYLSLRIKIFGCPISADIISYPPVSVKFFGNFRIISWVAGKENSLRHGKINPTTLFPEFIFSKIIL